MKKSCVVSLGLVLSSVLFTACSGGDDNDGNGSSNDTLTGVFIDSAVEGLQWRSGELEGSTDAQGTFQYKAGDSVAFYVGDILLGEVQGDSVIVPLDLVPEAKDITHPKVTNIARFLITLDNDSNPENGIQIHQESANLALGQGLDFSLATESFAQASDVQALMKSLTAATDAGERELVSRSEAQNHLEDSFVVLVAGEYRGTASDGSTTSDWQGTLGSDGVFRGTVDGPDGEVDFLGTVDMRGGETSISAGGGVEDGTLFSGVFQVNGSVAGTWNYFGEESGTWEGEKVTSAASSIAPENSTGEQLDANLEGSHCFEGYTENTCSSLSSDIFSAVLDSVFNRSQSCASLGFEASQISDSNTLLDLLPESIPRGACVTYRQYVAE